MQIVLARLEVVVLIRILYVRSLCHVLRDVVVALTGHSGDNDNGCIGIRLCAVDQLACIVFGRRLGQIPILCSDGDRCAVLCVAFIEVDQILIDFETCAFKSVDQADYREQSVHTAGARAAIDGIGGSPAEEIELCSAGQRQQVFLVLQKDKAFFSDMQCRLRSFCSGLLCNLAAAGCQCDQSVHGAEADHVDNDRDACDRRDPGFLADQGSEFLLFFAHRDSDDDRGNEQCSDGDEIGFKSLQYADQVFHFKRYHCLPPFTNNSCLFISFDVTGLNLLILYG